MRATYGEEWRLFRDWYWSRWWTRKRCVWCRTRGKYGNWIELNHLTYVRGDNPAWWQVAPMCHRCHGWETRLTRMFFGEWGRRTNRNAHYWVTYTGQALVLAPILAVAVWVWAWIGLPWWLLVLWLVSVVVA